MSAPVLNLAIIVATGLALTISLFVGWQALQEPDMTLVDKPAASKEVVVPDLKLNHTYQRQGAEINPSTSSVGRENPF